jgi:hypothetical protein
VSPSLLVPPGRCTSLQKYLQTNKRRKEMKEKKIRGKCGKGEEGKKKGKGEKGKGKRGKGKGKQRESPNRYSIPLLPPLSQASQ